MAHMSTKGIMMVLDSQGPKAKARAKARKVPRAKAKEGGTDKSGMTRPERAKVPQEKGEIKRTTSTDEEDPRVKGRMRPQRKVERVRGPLSAMVAVRKASHIFMTT
jgi:hypothetical protein